MWKVRKAHKPKAAHIWDVFEPDGTWSGSFDNWYDAMTWATSLAARVEYWLASQVAP